MRRLAVALLAAALLAVPVATADAAQYSCSPGPVDCSGWHPTSVTLRWFPSSNAVDSANCPTTRLISAEGANRWECRELIGSTWVPTVATVRIDKTAPRSVTATARPPDANGWYRDALRVAFTGVDSKPGIAVSGIAACTSFAYTGPDTGGQTFSGTCRDRAGNVSAASSFALRFDGTPPVVGDIRASRKPNKRGWYTRPVGFSVSASDATSGLAACDPLIYSGPDGAAAPVVATCRDRAGNTASRAFSIPFDATPPALLRLRAKPGDRRVRLDWSAAGATAVEVSRSPGRGGDERTTLRSESGDGLVDRSVRNGRRYEYRVTAVDQAGNATARTVVARPGRRLIAPAPKQVVSGPPLLRWTRVRGADYYNVQLYRNGRKVLSRWPGKARLQLKAQWRYRGVRRLRDGEYRWMVWPGEGARARNDYGRRIGKRTFVVDAP